MNMPPTEETVKGINALDTLCTLGEDIVGQLANFLIDLNMPQESEFLCDVLIHCLAKQQTEMGKFNRHKLLDRHARIYLRQGKPEAAIAKYKRKRQESMRDFREDGHRELAWLLYITAFVGHQDASAYADEAKTILANATIGEGNDNNIYLMRALAVWAWRDNDQAAVELLMQYAKILRERLDKGDAGPSGFIFSYLHLYQRANPKVRLDLPALDAVQAALDSDGYWIELVALSCLLNAGDKQRWLKNFQTQRADCLQYLEKMPAWLVEEWDFKASVERQNRREVEVFLDDTTREKLVKTGLLPL
jgi:hypothetical protein